MNGTSVANRCNHQVLRIELVSEMKDFCGEERYSMKFMIEEGNGAFWR